ncbi:hypothetical protein NJT12_03435 [Flavobacterium sp. AC]|uniref:Four helix bundle protein n=1 Tax=Flavobacterium azizsancarii TaxID=2961580 RepID=A0ABT4W964_9FLAO|nr:hypothetical protein [Flavobacterium azizsancarii]MDA6068664.1 hypothetical protein [Flavobacterium azizsancarii]
MKIDIKLPQQTFVIIATTLQPVYNSTPHTRKEKSTLSIALDVVTKIESKTGSINKQSTLFDQKKTMKISFKHHEADILELLLIDQMKYVEDDYIKMQIQKTINLLNQKLV